MQWLRHYVGFSQHPKVFSTASTLRVHHVVLKDMLNTLWEWAAVQAKDGVIWVSETELARIMRWDEYAPIQPDGHRMNAEVLLLTLVNTRWIDIINGRYVLHEWSQHYHKQSANPDARRRYVATRKQTIEKERQRRATKAASARKMRANRKKHEKLDDNVIRFPTIAARLPGAAS